MEFKLLNISEKYFIREIYRNCASFWYPEHSGPALKAQRHHDETYMSTSSEISAGGTNVVHFIIIIFLI